VRGALFLPSGGLRYHARALRHRRGWAPFRDRLARFLVDDWNPPRDRPLLLIGCSAGWCLPLDVVADVGRAGVVACDVDPLALWILARRLKPLLPPVATIATRTGDALGVDGGRAGRRTPGAALAALLAEHPRANVLFCNVWGQVIFDVKDDVARARWKAALPRLLRGRTWASFFDRVSGTVAPTLSHEPERSARSLPDDQLVERFYAHADTPLSTFSLVDHGTEDILVDHPRLYLSWNLSPGAHHLIEAICARPRDDDHRVSEPSSTTATTTTTTATTATTAATATSSSTP
jgi:hypothetical protein